MYLVEIRLWTIWYHFSQLLWLAQSGLNLPKLAQTCPKWPKVEKIGRKDASISWPNLFDIYSAVRVHVRVCDGSNFKCRQEILMSFP